MRRRPHVLVFVVGAAAVLLLSAPARSLPPPWLSQENAAIATADNQQSPAIAVDPAPGAALSAAVVANDVNFTPPRSTAAATLDWTAGSWTSPSTFSHQGSSASAGQPDVAWGIDSGGNENVYAVDTGATGLGACNTNSGIFLSTSHNGGVSWSTGVFVNSSSNSSELIEPAIALDRSLGTLGRIYVAYTRFDWAVPGCSNAPDSSQILLAYTDNEGINWTTRRVSPLPAAGAPNYRSPALAVQPDGLVTVAFRNDAAGSAQIEAETCTTAQPPAHYCGAASTGAVGASAVLGDATAPATVSGVSGAPTPSVVAAGGRVTVAWHASSGGAVHAFAAMSTNGGSAFGPAQPIDPTGTGNQIAPQLAATADGRVDAAYLWDPAGTGIVSATVASAGPPLPGATTEAWGNPVVVQSVGAGGATGRRLGVATAAISALTSPLPATVVAFTDTQVVSSQDVHVVGLLHGTTAPVIAPSQTVIASKNISTIVHVDATDADGDPLTWSTGIGPTTSGSSVSTADPARGEFAYKAANVTGPDTFEAVATDGAGKQARAMVNVNVVNDPPKITCSVLITREDTGLPVKASDCVTDPNNDPVTITLSDPIGGGLEHASGTWLFVPALHSTKTGSFVLHASDGDKTADQTVLVTVASTIGKVNLTVKDAGKTLSVASGMALRMKGSAVDATGVATPIFWDFGEHTHAQPTRGTAVAHRFRKPGTFTVTATADQETRKIKVVVRRRAVELVGIPTIVDGVMELDVRTRAGGKLLLRADSRSQTIPVPAGLTEQILRIQVTTGPLVRLTLRLKPAKAAPTLRVFSLRRLVLVSPLSAG